MRNTPNAFSEPVADTVLGYVLVLARQLDRMNADMHDGRWRSRSCEPLPSRRWASSASATAAAPWPGEPPPSACGSWAPTVVAIAADVKRATGLEQVPLDTLLRESDVVSLNCTLTPSSFHLIDRAALALMKPAAFLINTCRGPVVEERALVDALAAGRLAGAALDVFEEEPLPADSPLRSLQNCWLAPHNANSSVAAAERVHENTIRALLEGLARPVGRPLAV